MLTIFMLGANMTSPLFYADQVRARLTVFETRDATLELVATDPKRQQEEDRQHLVTQQAKKVQCITLFVPTPFLVTLRFH